MKIIPGTAVRWKSRGDTPAFAVLAQGSGSEGVGFSGLGDRNRGGLDFVSGGEAVVVIEAEHGDDAQGGGDGDGTDGAQTHEGEERNCGGGGEEDEGCFHDVSYFEVLVG